MSPSSEPSWFADSEVRHGRSAIVGLALCYYYALLQQAATTATAAATAATSAPIEWSDASAPAVIQAADTLAASSRTGTGHAGWDLSSLGGSSSLSKFFAPGGHGFSPTSALSEQLHLNTEGGVAATTGTPFTGGALGAVDALLAASSRSLQGAAEAVAGLELSQAQALAAVAVLGAVLAAGEIRRCASWVQMLDGCVKLFAIMHLRMSVRFFRALRFDSPIHALVWQLTYFHISEAQRRAEEAQPVLESDSWVAAAARGTAGLSGGLTLKPVVPAGGRLAALLGNMRPIGGGFGNRDSSSRKRSRSSGGSSALDELTSGLRERLAASELVHGRVSFLKRCFLCRIAKISCCRGFRFIP